MSVVIEANELSKRYRLGGANASSLSEFISTVARRSGRDRDEIWALRDVSFDVQEGETLGIIGRNGAGKSTLLKILSRITKPTRGSARIHGRVGTLLEVGTGFHSELSGRENIYLNGAILGMSRAEINSKFDEIVAFSEIEQFLDTPVKRYSSGMYMRLAFSVAAHLEPHILIVDEVLAVGDIGFQKKCLGKMDEVRRSGRTVLFVSHNLGSLAQICERGIVLDRGGMIYDGPIREALHRYAALMSSESRITVPEGPQAIGITSVALHNANGDGASQFFHDQGFTISIRGRVLRHRRGAMFCIALLNQNKQRVFTEHKDVEQLLGRTGDFHVLYKVPGDYVAPNNYSLLLQIFMPDGEIVQELNDVCPLEIVDAGSAMVSFPDHGCVVSKGNWEVCPD